MVTGRTHGVQELADIAFQQVGLGWEDYIAVDQALFRSAEADLLVGVDSKAKIKLGWEPEVPFEKLIAMVVQADPKSLNG